MNTGHRDIGKFWILALGVLGAAGILAAAVLAANSDEKPKVHPDTTGWDPLFAPDLSNADYPEGVWKFEDGVLTATEDQNIFTKKAYDDFILDLEFKNAEGTNSGVVVYCSDKKDWVPNSVEVQIADDWSEKWSSQPASWQCGAIFGHLPASRTKVVKKPGEWNRMTVTCRGPIITVALNGEQITRMDMRKWTSAEKNPDGTEIPKWLSRPVAELQTKGYVGFQGKHGGAPIWFRNIRIKTLPTE